MAGTVYCAANSSNDAVFSATSTTSWFCGCCEANLLRRKVVSSMPTQDFPAARYSRPDFLHIGCLRQISRNC
jgi:hypothetical protein